MSLIPQGIAGFDSKKCLAALHRTATTDKFRAKRQLMPAPPPSGARKKMPPSEIRLTVNPVRIHSQPTP